MTDGQAAYDEQGLPWLEAVDDEDGPRGVSAKKMLAGLFAVLLAVGIVGATLFWIGRRDAGRTAGGAAELIRAEPGPYKVRPDDPGGLDVAGDSGTAFATGAGEDRDAEIDLGAVAETPIARPVKIAPKPEPAPEPKSFPGNETKEPVAPDAPAPVQSGGSGSVIQLGAFSSAAKAEGAWNALTARFPAIGAMGKIIVPVKSGTATLYRLRAGAASPADAKQACASLRVAGESCVVIG